jgi:uncharacterized membrane protein
MVSLYGLFVLLHVLAAIIGMGSTFAFPLIRKSAVTVSQLRYALGVLQRLERLPALGGAAIVVTGIVLMILSGAGLSLMWLNLSIFLVIVMIVLLTVFIGPRMKNITRLVFSSQDEQIPAEYIQSIKKIAPIETAVQAIIVAVIVLMVLKPF